ncbi:transcription antitermination factor NusB [Wolbachia endosymbiont of Pentidionis agamae]|uniref:transcription antitermination factor NusB n=1 Tax=Wolbachia endosymbiont of Pentidionis agamae TaxID=3110435 RepID=UPI002FD0A57D
MEESSSDIYVKWHKKTFARFLAVQVAYSRNFVCYKTTTELNDYIKEIIHVLKYQNYDHEFLDGLCQKIINDNTESDKIIESCLNENWSLSRINLSSLSILRVAICEWTNYDTPVPVIINEYTNISSSLVEKSSEVNFISGLLNKVKYIQF